MPGHVTLQTWGWAFGLVPSSDLMAQPSNQGFTSPLVWVEVLVSVWMLGEQKKARGTKSSSSGLHLRRKKEKYSGTQRGEPCWTVINAVTSKRVQRGVSVWGGCGCGDSSR